MEEQNTELARAIAGTAADAAPPHWLVVVVPKLVQLLRSTIDSEHSYPSRPDAWGWLEELRNAARLILRGLVNQRMFPLLLTGPSDRLINENEGFHFLMDLVRSVDVALARPELSEDARGSHKVRATFDNTLDPKTLCALMVSVARNCAEGRWPGQRNPSASRACTMLWKATGAPWNSTGESWRRYLVKARDCKDSWQAGAIARMLGQATPETRWSEAEDTEVTEVEKTPIAEGPIRSI